MHQSGIRNVAHMATQTDTVTVDASSDAEVARAAYRGASDGVAGDEAAVRALRPELVGEALQSAIKDCAEAFSYGVVDEAWVRFAIAVRAWEPITAGGDVARRAWQQGFLIYGDWEGADSHATKAVLQAQGRVAVGLEDLARDASKAWKEAIKACPLAHNKAWNAFARAAQGG